MAAEKKPDKEVRNIQIPTMVSQKDLDAVGGRAEMSKILREARDKGIKPDVSISLERAKKYARHQHYVGKQQREFVEFEDWARD